MGIRVTAFALGVLAIGLATSVQVPALSADAPLRATMVSTGLNHSCAVTTGGGVLCWGDNGSGQLGNNSTTKSNTPVPVVGLSSGVVSVAAGWGHTCALTSGGEIQCWGSNYHGELGDNSKVPHLIPMPVIGLANPAVKVSASKNYTCAILSNGAATCWGDNPAGQLGDGSTTERLVPTPVVGLSSDVIDIATGQLHTCALLAPGIVKCWGYNLYGQLGNNSNLNSSVPVPENGVLSNAVRLALGWHHSCAVLNTGEAKCWGRNEYGTLGNGQTTNSPTPVVVQGLNLPLMSMSAGFSDTCGLTIIGSVKCWGLNASGQLGDRTNNNSLVPVDVQLPGVTTLSSGQHHNCVQTSNGGLRCWGHNYNGQLGNGLNTNSNVPVCVNGFLCESSNATEPAPVYLLKWGSDVTRDGSFNKPQGIAVDNLGNLYVADTYNNRVQKFDRNGTFLKKWGVYGNGNGTFREVWDVAVDGNNNVYVADPNNHVIQKFSSEGIFTSQFGGYGSNSGKLMFPYGVAVDSFGNVYVAEWGNHRIQKFSNTGAPLAAWGSLGSGDNQLNGPWDIAVDNLNNVYVADTGNNRIVKYDSNGTSLLQWGMLGSLDGQFNRPQALGVDNNGRVYVADSGNTRIQVFSNAGTYQSQWPVQAANRRTNPTGIAIESDGKILVPNNLDLVIRSDINGTNLQQWGTSYTGDGQLAIPYVLGTDASGNIYVADEVNNRIQKFDGAGGFLAKWGTFGSNPGQLSSPSGGAVDAGGNVYVLDRGNSRIQKFSSSGAYQLSWGWGVSADISAMALDSAGNIYLADRSNSLVRKFSNLGVPVSTWGGAGSLAGQFNRPAGIAVSASGDVYVADAGNYRIQKFTGAGVFVRMWGWGVKTNADAFEVCAVATCLPGKPGYGEGQFLQTSSLSVDSMGNVLTTETSGPRRGFTKFSSEGNLISRYEDIWGIGNGQFFQPSAIAVDRWGNVFVSDRFNWRVQKFGNSPTGANVTVTSNMGASTTTIAFGNVITSGNTKVTASMIAPPLPAGFKLGSLPIYYDVSTSATFSVATVCITYYPMQFRDPTQLRLLHYSNNSWVDVTTSTDTTNHKICGQVAAFSPFAVVRLADSTPATINPSISGALGANNWYTGDVDVSWSVSDPESGVVSSTGCATTKLTAETAGTTLTCSATNGAGLVSTKSVNIKIDKTKPTVSITSPQTNGVFTHTLKIPVTWSAGDPMSGVALQSATLDGNVVTNGQIVDLLSYGLGTHTVTVIALDNAGNSQIATSTFRVTADANSLSEVVNRAVELGWISNTGIADSLYGKLDAIRNAIARGQTTAAKNQLQAFLNELEAQKGKAINQQAYDLLKTDALYLLSTLP